MSQVVPVITRTGLASIWNETQDGISAKITHIGVGTSGYNPDADQAELQQEVGRWEIIDGEQVNDNQLYLYSQITNEGVNPELVDENGGFWIKEIGFYFEDGTLFAVHSVGDGGAPEAYKSQSTVLDVDYQLVLEAVPNGSVTVVNTGIRFNPDVKESLQQLAAGVIDQIVAQNQDRETIDKIKKELALSISDFETRIEVAVKAERLLMREDLQSLSSRDDDLDVDINKLGATLAWQSESEASYRRTMGQSGIFGVRHYGYHGYLRQPHTENGQPAHNHNHPQYQNLAGSGEVQFVMNGYLGKTRHRDYGLNTPKTASDPFLATEYIKPPELPSSVTSGTIQQQSDAMRDLFMRYQNGEMPEGFGWTMSALQAWFVPFAEEVQDAYHSDRHQQEVNTISSALRSAVRFSSGGGRDMGENVALEPLMARTLDSNGKTVFGILKHRMICVDVSSLGDLRPHIAAVDDPIRSVGRGATSNRFLIKENINAPGELDKMMYLLPGLDGYDSVIEERYIAGGDYFVHEYHTDERLNANFHTRFVRTADDDASNRSQFKRAFNDPYLFVASTTREQVLSTPVDGIDYRFSYAIPMELILRTPLESWNPHGIPEVASVEGTGTQASPYSGNHPNGYWYRTPIEFFTGSSFGDPADTVSSGGRWFVGSDGQPKKVRESGLWIHLPPIDGLDERVRTRYAIFPDHTEGGKAWQHGEAVRRSLQGVSAGVINNMIKLDKLESK